MFFFNQVVLRRPELLTETFDEDMLLTFSKTGACSGLILSSFMLDLPSILHNSQDVISCVAQVWIVSSEYLGNTCSTTHFSVVSSYPQH